MSSNFHPLKSRKWVQMILVVIVLLATLFAGGPFVTQAEAGGPPPLFGSVDNADHAAIPSLEGFDPSVARSRYMNVNLGLLFDANGNPRGRKQLPQITLNLFPDVNYVGVVTGVESDGLSASWTGRLKGAQYGYFYLVAVDGIFMAHIASTEGIYEVSWAGDNLYQAIQIDQSKSVDDGIGEAVPSGTVLSKAELATLTDSGAIIDVIVFYNAAARTAAGGTTQIKAAIKLAMDETNGSYTKSGVKPVLRLVHAQEISYTESGTLSTDVDRLANISDGYMDDIHSWRNSFGADLVMLIVETSTDGYCGWAKAPILASATTAFAVTRRKPNCMTGYYSFGHELGHLQGARHDLYVDTADTPYTYSHGYVHKHATLATQRWRTVMAYDNACTAAGYKCTRLQYWSNPTKTWLTAAMGVVDDSENYKALNNTAATVANFRASVISTDNFNSTFNGSSTGWSSVYGTWAIASSAYYRTNGVAGYASSAQHTGTYGDLTYEVQMKRAGCATCANRIIIRGSPTFLDPWKAWKPSYEFAYNNNGQFGVFRIDSAGNVSTIKNWTASAAIIKKGWNTLKIVAVGASFTYYINNVKVWSNTNPDIRIGSVGFGMYRDTTSTGNVFDVNYAKITTTPLSAPVIVSDAPTDSNMEEVPGGDNNQAP